MKAVTKKEKHSSPSTPRVKPITISVIRGQTTDFVLSKQIQHGRLHWMLDTKCISNSPITQYICLPSPPHSKQDTSLTSYLSIKRNGQNRDKQQNRRKVFSLFKCKVFLDSICFLPPRMLWSPFLIPESVLSSPPLMCSGMVSSNAYFSQPLLVGKHYQNHAIRRQ